ncbi:hypothetical protein JB92DRAFT_3059075 [Gautieria morchelliformis]|nr:hypothetical protein JB92DRAFT_3059075 [Gautieria morchelliformis]
MVSPKKISSGKRSLGSWLSWLSWLSLTRTAPLLPISAPKESAKAAGKRPERQRKRVPGKILPDGKLYIHPDGSPYWVTRSNVANKTILRWLTPTRGNEDSMHMSTDDYDLPVNGKDDWAILEDTQYWANKANFPMHQPLPHGAEEEMLAALIYFTTELVMGNTKATSPFTLTQCLEIISLYKALKHETKEGAQFTAEGDERLRWFVTHVMLEICQARVKFNYGKVGAATTIEPSRVASCRAKRVLDIFLLILCFGGHIRYRKRFRRTHTNAGVHLATFRASVAGTLQEWSDCNLLGTVFITANMLFLISDLSQAQQTLVVVSTCCALASVIVGMYLAWQHRPKTEADISQAFDYLYHATGDPSGLTFTSVSICLPLVFLLWSIFTFAVAIVHFAYTNHTGVAFAFMVPVAEIIFLMTESIYDREGFGCSAWMTMHAIEAYLSDIMSYPC